MPNWIKPYCFLILFCIGTAGCNRTVADYWNRRTDKISPPVPEEPTDPRTAGEAQKIHCAVTVIGGSTAALAAALYAAQQGVATCLFEPTDWPGGQLTAGGVPAVDEAWHEKGTVPVKNIAREPKNMHPEFLRWLKAMGNPGQCWVSRFCFEPKNLLEEIILPAITAASPHLSVYYNTVPKSVVTTDNHKIESILLVQRMAKSGAHYNRLPSKDMPDWYAPHDSEIYSKKTLQVSHPQHMVVIDASEFGEILALAHAPYLIGAEKSPDNPLQGSVEDCGQAFTYTFAMELNTTSSPAYLPTSNQASHPDFYSLTAARIFTWDEVWSYRRLKGQGFASTGQISLMNWNPGNDYPFGYLFKNKADTKTEISDWRGGIDYQVLAEAEAHALGFFEWYRNQAPAFSAQDFGLAREVLGTGHGLAKIPYIRDTRRSIGIDDFIIRYADIEQPDPNNANTGRVFRDRVALGAYPADFHAMHNCQLPGISGLNLETLPFYIPLRALTNKGFENLLVAGKTMAQSFLVNAATRLHPIEFNSGTAAGIVAAWMIQNQATSKQAWQSVSEIQTKVQRIMPINWSD